VAQNLSAALTAVFGPVPVAIVPLITSRDELRARLRAARPGGGIAILAEASTAVAAYLSAEQSTGRLATDADIDSLTLSLVGGGHLLFADPDAWSPTGAALERFVTATIKDAVSGS
jgi:hypothetical protein